MALANCLSRRSALDRNLSGDVRSKRPARLTGARKSPPDQQLVGVIVVRGGFMRMEPDQAAVVSEEARAVDELVGPETGGDRDHAAVAAVD